MFPVIRPGALWARRSLATAASTEDTSPATTLIARQPLPRTVIFASERLEDAVAEQVVAALVEGRERLADVGFSFDPTRPFAPDIGVRYHRAALSYYKHSGLRPDRQVVTTSTAHASR